MADGNDDHAYSPTRCKPYPGISKKSGPSLPSHEHRASFLDPALMRLPSFGGVHPANKVPPLVRREIAPLRFRRRGRLQRQVKIQRHDRITAGAPLASHEHRTGPLDPALTRLCLLGGVDPTQKISARDWRQIVPLRVRRRKSCQGLAKIRGRLRIGFVYSQLGFQFAH